MVLKAAAEPSCKTSEAAALCPHRPVPRNVRAELRIVGEDLRAADIERLKKQIDLLMEALAEDPATD